MKPLSKKNKTGLFLTFICTVAFSFTALAQRPPAASPAMKDSIVLDGKLISVKYSAPSVKGRDIFSKTGQISKDPNYPVWRAGANAATILHTDADLEINGLAVPKGDYALYVLIEDPENWELIINKQTGQWGLTYKKDMDLGRVKMKMSKPASPTELLKYAFAPNGNKKATLTLSWEKYSGSVGVVVK